MSNEALGAYLLILLGSGLGGVGRYWLSGLVARGMGETFPWGTLIVNITGCFVIGFVDGLTRPAGLFPAMTSAREFAMTGVCGGYTTFSSFSLQTLTLMRRGAWGKAGWNVGASVIVCLLAVWLGHVAALALSPVKGA